MLLYKSYFSIFLPSSAWQGMDRSTIQPYNHPCWFCMNSYLRFNILQSNFTTSYIPFTVTLPSNKYFNHFFVLSALNIQDNMYFSILWHSCVLPICKLNFGNKISNHDFEQISILQSKTSIYFFYSTTLVLYSKSNFWKTFLCFFFLHI